jgi:hypothetical protein
LAPSSRHAKTYRCIPDAVRLYTQTDSQNVKASATYTANNGGGKGSTVTMTASGEIKSQFMQIAGFPTLDFSVGSTSTWGNSLLRIALVLDNTGSMAGTKISNLKTASKNLVDKLGALAKTPRDVMLSVIPFASAVNVGTDKASAAWLRWDLWDPRSDDSSGNSYCSSGRSSWYTMAMCKGTATPGAIPSARLRLPIGTAASPTAIRAMTSPTRCHRR